MNKKIPLFAALGILVMLLIVVGSLSFREPQSDVKVGSVLPLSGNSAAYGNWIREALQLVEEETNKTGGIQSKSLKIIYEDDQGQPSVAASAMQKLTNIDKVPLVYGSWVSSAVLAMAPIAERTRTVLIAEAISPKISEAGDYIFRFNLDARVALAKLIPFAAQKNNKFAILYINNDFGVDQANIFKKEMEKLGKSVVFNQGYDPSTTDFRSALTKIKNLQPDAIFIPGYLEIANILKQAQELGLKAQFYSSFPFENINILKIAGKAAEGVIYPFFFDAESQNPLMVEFQKKYKERYGRPAEGFAALGYFGMKLAVDVMRKVGIKSSEIREGLEQIKDYPTGFGPVSFDKKGDIQIPVLLKTVRDGKFVVLEQPQAMSRIIQMSRIHYLQTAGTIAYAFRSSAAVY
jgi:branched-chain amino acid transport system substrate-binding protein